MNRVENYLWMRQRSILRRQHHWWSGVTDGASIEWVANGGEEWNGKDNLVDGPILVWTTKVICSIDRAVGEDKEGILTNEGGFS